MFDKDTFKLIGPVRTVTSTFSELEVVGVETVEIRTQPAGYLLFDSDGRLIEEISPYRLMMEDVYKDIYVYNDEGDLIEREEYNEVGSCISKTVFESDDEGNLVENQYYLSARGVFVLESKVINGKDTIRFDVDG